MPNDWTKPNKGKTKYKKTKQSSYGAGHKSSAPKMGRSGQLWGGKPYKHHRLHMSNSVEVTKKHAAAMSDRMIQEHGGHDQKANGYRNTDFPC